MVGLLSNMFELTPESSWESLRVTRDELSNMSPEQLTLHPLLVVCFGGLDEVKFSRQPGECTRRVEFVGKQIAGILNGRFKPENVGRLLRTGVSEHVDGMPRYLQVNSSCAEDKKHRKLPSSDFAIDFTLRLKSMPAGMAVGSMFTQYRREYGIDQDYNQYMLLQRPVDPETQKEMEIEKAFLSDFIRPNRFDTLSTVTERLSFGDVAVFFNGMGNMQSSFFPTHETESLKIDEITGEWRETYDLPRSVALGRVTDM